MTRAMMDLYYWPSPNCWKVSIALEELGLAYRISFVNIRAGAQAEAGYLAINPNGRVPALIDHQPADGGGPLRIFESAAILLYLAEKTGRLLPAAPRGRVEALQWLMWQAAGFGPVAGQVRHFRDYSKEPNPGATARFVTEIERLYAVLEHRLDGRDFVADVYSIADISIWPFVLPYERTGQSLAAFPRVARWAGALLERPAIRRALALGAEQRRGGPLHEQVERLLSASN
jgi:GST-like protein